jgi:hypothetical protein
MFPRTFGLGFAVNRAARKVQNMKDSNRHTNENKSDSLQHTQMLAAMGTGARRGTHCYHGLQSSTRNACSRFYRR